MKSPSNTEKKRGRGRPRHDPNDPDTLVHVSMKIPKWLADKWKKEAAEEDRTLTNYLLRRLKRKSDTK